MDYNKIIGENIRKYRVASKLSIEELAEVMDVSPAFIGLIERGQRGLKVKSLIMLSQRLGISLDDFIKEDIEQLKVDVLQKETNKIATLCSFLKSSERRFVMAILKQLIRMRQYEKESDLKENN